MPIADLPAIDAAACQGWSPQDISLYNALPVWMIEREVAYRKKYGSFKRMLGSIPWTPNKGSTITGVVSEPPPTLRQFAFPEVLSTTAAKKDIIQYRERTFEFKLRHHKFESPPFQWLPAFQDFIAKKITKNIDFVMKWQEEYTAQFYRGFMFHQAPAIMFAGSAAGSGGSAVDDLAPTGDGNAAGTDGKSNAYLQAKIATMTGSSGLTMQNVFYALNYLEEDSLAPPYTSGSLKDDSFLNDKYLLMTSSEAFNNWINDPFLKEMKNCDLNVITEGFKGSLFGRLTTALHSNPLRALIATDGSISWPAPETKQENPAADNFGQTIRNPDYRRAQIEVAFMAGHQGYSIVDVGSPPAEWTATGVDRLGTLKWNGKPRLTDRFNVPCTDANDAIVWDQNTYDEFLKIISLVVMGIAGETTRNVLPIVFYRNRGITTTLS